jgi:hypothetical protein
MLLTPELKKWSNKKYWSIAGIGKEGETAGVEQAELMELAVELMLWLDKSQLNEVANVISNTIGNEGT